ncbi:hypothetical protein IFM89_004024 [Coptis chinensis]|uniref:Uncharacterized protein n=1 Tax=Coptis chinensis TaxID=261450 RepID=A0A835GU08_9MAGN|nr:hypothetical protein IFM89_004024 [Coptis chinensis]
MIRDCLENRIECVTLICKHEFVTLRKKNLKLYCIHGLTNILFFFSVFCLCLLLFTCQMV